VAAGVRFLVGLMIDSQMSKKVILGLNRAVRCPLRAYKTDGTRWGTMHFWTRNDGCVSRGRSELKKSARLGSDVPLNEVCVATINDEEAG